MTRGRACSPGCDCGRHTRLSVEEKFWRKVNLIGPFNPYLGSRCWLWTDALDKYGYGRLGMGERASPKLAHRLSYELLFGAPSDNFLDHPLGCPKNCVNPYHLRPATNKQNLENLSGANKNNQSSGVRGVYRSKDAWIGRLQHNGKVIHVGRFKTIAQAEAAVTAKRNEMFTRNDADRLR